jgi:hypothetical protein
MEVPNQNVINNDDTMFSKRGIAGWGNTGRMIIDAAAKIVVTESLVKMSPVLITMGVKVGMHMMVQDNLLYPGGVCPGNCWETDADCAVEYDSCCNISMLH